MTTPVILNPSTPINDLKTGLLRPEWYLFFNSLTGSFVSSVAVTGVNGIGVAGSPITSTGIIVLSLGAITPSSVAATGALSGSNFSGSSSGTNTGDQTITLTGDVTGSGTGSFATTLADFARLKSKIITFLRSPGTASGSVSYTGAGFKPHALMAFGAQNTAANVGFNGFCDSALNQSCLFDGANFDESNSSFLTVGVSGANQTGVVSSLDADGFTVSWTKNGAPGGGDYNCAVLCLG